MFYSSFITSSLIHVLPIFSFPPTTTGARARVKTLGFVGGGYGFRMGDGWVCWATDWPDRICRVRYTGGAFGAGDDGHVWHVDWGDDRVYAVAVFTVADSGGELVDSSDRVGVGRRTSAGIVAQYVGWVCFVRNIVWGGDWGGSRVDAMAVVETPLALCRAVDSHFDGGVDDWHFPGRND